MDPAINRILDANGNRAREALRVMEEYARFVLCDGTLSVSVKQVRHELSEAVSRLESGGPAPAITHRDIVHDVGRDLSTSEGASLTAGARRVDSCSPPSQGGAGGGFSPSKLNGAYGKHTAG